MSIKELSQQILTEKNTKILPDKIKNSWNIFDIKGKIGTNDLNIFIQNTEPTVYDGIWIKSSNFVYNGIEEIDDIDNTVPSSINILTGDLYATSLYDSGISLKYLFNGIYLTDSNNDIVYDIEIYYGNETEWVEITPAEPVYTELEYLETTGTQYIDTGIKSGSTIDIEIKAKLNQNGATVRDGVLLGARTSAGSNDSYVCWYNNAVNVNRNDISFRMCDDSTMMATENNFISHTIKQVGQSIYLDGSLYYTSPVRNVDSDNNIFLLALNKAGTVDTRMFLGRFYFCKIWNNNILVRDFIPVKDSNDIVCLYDKVRKKFFYNKGTGDFIAGYSTDYIELAYIQSTGTQYINTGVSASQWGGYEFDFQLTSTGSSDSTTLIGARTTGSGSERFALMNYSNKFYQMLGSSDRFMSSNAIDTNRHKASINISSSGSYTGYFDSSTFTGTVSGSNCKVNTNFYIFWDNYRGKASMKLYWAKLYSLGVLKKDLIPVKRKSDNVVCLYDKVNKSYILNAGSGTFTAGPVI